MDAESAEKAKARRDRNILLVCMAVGILLPVVLFWLVQIRAER
jgi:hypothetical protein